jgi:CHAD domain-containing protein
MEIAGGERVSRRVVKALKPLRKAAGVVRDMDVLAARARTLVGRGCDDSVAALVKALRARRVEGARELAKAAKEDCAEARGRLKEFARQIEKRVRAGEDTDAAVKLMDELNGWPAFGAENLHAFRIKVKELRYVLQLAGAADLRFVRALEKAKSRIGDWHDWLELRRIAGEVLKRGALLKEIDGIEREKLTLALAAARAVRAQYLGAHRGGVVGEI